MRASAGIEAIEVLSATSYGDLGAATASIGVVARAPPKAPTFQAAAASGKQFVGRRFATAWSDAPPDVELRQLE
jgi:hypothetical protein